jgi:SAM-dependent methyltransferase
LEVGCGQGTMASVWAGAGANVTAVDLNPQAVEQTKRRFELFGLNGTVQRADGRTLPFQDHDFDYAYSWGVLHHSPDLARSLSELMRVLKPGGGFGVMLYNRRSLLQWWIIQYFEGFVHYESRFLDPLELASRYTDGLEKEGNPHTWPVTKSELRRLVSAFSDDFDVSLLDEKMIIGHYLPPGLRDLLPRALQKPWARRLGWSLWTYGTKTHAASSGSRV